MYPAAAGGRKPAIHSAPFCAPGSSCDLRHQSSRGVVLACVAVMLLGFTPVPRDDWWRESKLLPEAQRGAEWMAGFLPPAAAGYLDFSDAEALAAPAPPVPET